ncbi:MAG: DUF5723 family protein [Gemmatimonadota bacterium]|nr:DUF5723 family protein [Gemmatimonadota bacterium]MDH5758117.1 DUF5723 family protein [Gemmatimonadota bacterium]
MNTRTRPLSLVAFAAGLVSALGGSPSDVGAQLANASATTLGQGGVAAATVRGFAALGANPAGLGMPGSGFSLAILPTQFRSGLNPVSLSDLALVEGTILTDAQRDEWLTEIAANGGQNGYLGLEVSGVSFTVGHFGIQLSTLAGASLNLDGGLAELVLFGNAGRTGEPREFTLTDTGADAFAVSTAGVSFAVPFSSDEMAVAVGATVKYSMGHKMAVVRDQGSVISSDPVAVQVALPVLHTSGASGWLHNGSGIGLDLGIQMERGDVAMGASVVNVFNTFAWDATTLTYRAGTASADIGSASSDFVEQPVSAAPAAILASVENLTFDPILSAGAAVRAGPVLTLSADVRRRFGEGIHGSRIPRSHAGLGAELSAGSVLSVQAGAAVITDGDQYSGGVSLGAGKFNLSVAGAVQRRDLGDTLLGMVAISVGGR